MDALISSLPQSTTNRPKYFYVINISENANEGNVCTKAQVAAAKAKGWISYAWNGEDWVEYEGSDEIVMSSAHLSVEPFSIKAGEENELVVDLTNPEDEITQVQFDLRLPAGLSVKAATP